MALLTTCVAAAIGAADAWAQARDTRAALLAGDGVQIHVGFPYYQGRSPESIAEEIEVNGFTSVLYLVCNEDADLSPELVAALHRRGIGVWGGYFSTGVYTPESLLPPGWEEWRMESLVPDAYRHFSFVHAGYREWLKQRIASGFATMGFDGFLLMETFYPNWGGPERQPTDYIDVSPAFQAAFREATGHDAFPDFTDPADPHYYQTDEALYRDLVEYRAKALADFYGDVVNGPGGVRERFPGTTVATWTTGAAFPDASRLLREWEGHDAGLMVRTVRPEMHFLQTHWPDWSRPDLPPDYTDGYVPLVAEAKAADPAVRIGFQADIGSLVPMRKSPAWHREYCRHAHEIGIDATTYYEFHLRWEVYFQAPELRRLVRGSEPNTVRLLFDHRLDPASVEALADRVVTDLAGTRYTIGSATCDGATVVLGTVAELPAGVTLAFPVGGISDLPAVRLGGAGEPNTIPPDACQWGRL